MLKDKDIRGPLFEFLEDTYGKIRIIEENTVGSSRADIVMITDDILTGIEIKSDADTYVRLSGQVKDYDRYFDKNIVVVGTTHALHIEEHVPPYWGIITVEEVEGVLDFYILRQPDNNSKVKLKKKLSILWRPELFEIQMLFGMPKYKDKNKDFVIDKICGMIPEKFSLNELNEQISRILFERDYTKIEEILQEYRKGEFQKAIEKESDPQKKLELFLEKEKKAANLKPKKKRRRRKRLI
jgi:hypothetical protein